MMDYLKINFQQMRDGSMKKTFEALERAFSNFGIDFYLIGAFARDMWMNYLTDLPLRRTTRDIDFSLHISELKDFEDLKNFLVKNEGFILGEEPYRMFAPDETIVDLLPFGGIENNGTVYLEGDKPIDLSVFGNMLVLNHAAVIPVETCDFKICTLPGLCIMKLISGNEKPDRFNKDIGDFYYIVENYSEIAGELIFDGEFEDLIDDNYVPEIASAKMLGRQINVILADAEPLKQKVAIILNKLKQNFTEEEADAMYQAEPKDQTIKRIKMLTVLHQQIK